MFDTTTPTNNQTTPVILADTKGLNTPRGMLVNPLAPHLTGTLSAKTQAQILELRSTGKLSPFACHNSSVIRRVSDASDADTILRPAFVRDCEKILHTPAYNRLNGKTQVFSFRQNDDITRRGLHEQMVGRVARDIGAALGLNLDLIEAISLGHDVGHTPFGHAGERFLHKVYHEHTGRYFFHNVQSVRVLDVIYGRNLSLQTLDGVICHNGEFEKQVLTVSGLNDFDTFDRVVEDCWNTGETAIGVLKPMTLEGCVMRISDIIAYVGKDRQDAICAGLVSEDAFDDGLGGGYNAWALGAFIADIVEHSLGKSSIQMSEEAFLELKRAKRENYQKIYKAKEVEGDFSRDVEELFARLYEVVYQELCAGDTTAPIFMHHIYPLQKRLLYYQKTYEWQDDLDACVVDYIASMTDDYFVALCKHYFADAAALFPERDYFGTRA